MQSLKVAGPTAIAHFSKLLVALLTIKLIAVSVGPEGLGFLGNYMSLISIATALAGGGVITGVVKYVSEFPRGSERQKAFIGNALVYSVIFSVLVVLIGCLLIEPISYYIFGSVEYSGYLVLFLFIQFVAALVNLAYGVLNGLQRNVGYAFVVVVGNISSLALAYYSITYYDMAGAVTALALPLVLPLLPIIFIFSKYKISFDFSFMYFLSDCKRLSRFTLMLIVSAVCFPVVEIFVRSNIAESVGADAVGIWQAMIRLSGAYLSFFSVFLSFYLVPKISGENNKIQILRSVCLTMFFLSICFGGMLFFVLLIKDQLVIFVFSENFLDVAKYLAMQMIGDYFRIMGWVIGFVVVAKAATKLYVASELFQGLIFMVMTYVLFLFSKEVSSVIFAYLITCISYFVMCVIGFFIFMRKGRL